MRPWWSLSPAGAPGSHSASLRRGAVHWRHAGRLQPPKHVSWSSLSSSSQGNRMRATVRHGTARALLPRHAKHAKYFSGVFISWYLSTCLEDLMRVHFCVDQFEASLFYTDASNWSTRKWTHIKSSRQVEWYRTQMQKSQKNKYHKNTWMVLILKVNEHFSVDVLSVFFFDRAKWQRNIGSNVLFISMAGLTAGIGSCSTLSPKAGPCLPQGAHFNILNFWFCFKKKNPEKVLSTYKRFSKFVMIVSRFMWFLCRTFDYHNFNIYFILLYILLYVLLFILF